MVLTLGMGMGWLKSHSAIDVPTLRLGLGYSPLKVSAGQVLQNVPLKSILTLNPMFLWDAPAFRSRLGLHFLTDMGSPFGLVTTSGLGLSWVFYPLGLSSAREKGLDGVEVRKTRVSPYFMAQITPTRFTLAGTREDTETFEYFSSLVVETSLGAGLDYPLNDNMVLFGGLNYRFAAITKGELSSEAINYSGIHIQIGVMSSFF